MTDAVTIKCTTADGKPLDVLARLIQERTRVMRESTKDAVVATAIDALTSIRAATSVMKPSKVKRSDVEVRELTDAVPVWRGRRGNCRREIRVGGATYNFDGVNDKGENGVRNLMGRYAHGEKPRVFWAKYSPPWSKGDGLTGKHSDPIVGIYIAKNAAQVIASLVKKGRRRARRNASVSRNIISAAMGMVSTRGSKKTGKPRAQMLADRYASVTRHESGNSYGISFTDNLGSSLAAVKGGAQGVETAIKKAANKVAGKLAQKAKGTFDEGAFTTPFPEVKRK